MAKRALVVDDSKSARAFLTRLLEDQQIEVDATETAELAIEYLAHNRPDVIFMDHLMPGMDGFQAVQAIKANPRTATIPILMYTSQEGELYLGQARALGAAGVLPKNVAPADVHTVLQQLHLLEQPEPPTVAAQQEVLDAAVAAAASVRIEKPVLPMGPPVEELLREQSATLRRHMAESLEDQAQRLTGEMRSMLLESMPRSPELPPTEPAAPRHSPVAWLVALAASVAAAVLGTLLWHEQQQLRMLRLDLADSRSTVSLLTARLVPYAPTTPAVPATVTSTDIAVGNVVERVSPVPFGETPLAGARVDALREFVTQVATLGQQGTVRVQRFTGRFCLSGNVSEGFTLAEAATPYIGCDLVADATDPALGKSGPESVAFANTLAELRRTHASLLDIEVDAQPGEGGEPYPEIDGTPPRVPSAGEWNAVAERNNRVEIRWQPAP